MLLRLVKSYHGIERLQKQFLNRIQYALTRESVYVKCLISQSIKKYNAGCHVFETIHLAAHTDHTLDTMFF